MQPTLETKIEQQTKEIDAMRSDIRELVDAWKAAGGAGRIEFIIMRGRHPTFHSWFK